MTSLLPRAGILDIAPYDPGSRTLPGFEDAIVLASNEAALGPSPNAVEAAQKACSQLDLYPDMSVSLLRAATASRYKLAADRLLFGPGSETVLDLIFKTYCRPGDEVLFPKLSFPLYAMMTLANGGWPVEADAPDFTADVDRLLDAVTLSTRMVVLANPCNPKGTWIPRAALLYLRENLPEDVLLIIDSAYADYMSDAAYSDGVDIVNGSPENTLMVRTFSKAYGLAGARVGWAYGGTSLIDALLRTRMPYCVSAPAEAAAHAALLDQSHLAAEIDHCRDWRTRLADHMTACGLSPVPSAANFILLPVPAARGGPDALDAVLRAHGILVRKVPPAGALRITIGTASANERLMEALTAFSKRGEVSNPALQ